MNFKKWVKSIQTAGYNGARTVYEIGSLLYTAIVINVVSILKVDKNVKVPPFFRNATTANLDL